MNAAEYMRSTLLRYVSPPLPQVWTQQMGDSSHPLRALMVIATGKARAKVDGIPVADLEDRLVVYDGQRHVRHRVGGVLIVAVRAVDGMLVQSGRDYYVIARGFLARVDQLAHDYLLGLRRASGIAAADRRTRGRVDRPTSAQPRPITNAPGGAS